jgi:hypothetical protein
VNIVSQKLDAEQRRRVKRTARVLALAAVCIYGGYILWFLWRGAG